MIKTRLNMLSSLMLTAMEFYISRGAKRARGPKSALKAKRSKLWVNDGRRRRRVILRSRDAPTGGRQPKNGL